MDLTQIGLAIRTARTVAGMSAVELARAAKLTGPALSKIEKGNQKLDFNTAIAITGALNISLDNLATLAKKVSTVKDEGSYIRKQLASQLKSLEKDMLSTAILLMQEDAEEEENSHVREVENV